MCARDQPMISTPLINFSQWNCPRYCSVHANPSSPAGAYWRLAQYFVFFLVFKVNTCVVVSSLR